MREIRVLTEGSRQCYLTIPKAIVHRLFSKDADGRYYVRMYVEGNGLRVTPMELYSEALRPDPLEELKRLQQLED